MSERVLPAEAYAVRLKENVSARMRDGTVLRADIYRPRVGGPFPVLLLRTPYGKHQDSNVRLAESLAARGYVVVVQDIRGRYASDGDWDPFFSPTYGEIDVHDGYETVEWAAGVPDTTGRVGTFGLSYDAWTQWKLAPMRPPHLVAMFASGLSSDSRDTWPGIFRRDRQLQWIMVTVGPDMRRRLGLPGPHTVAEARIIWDNLDKGKWLWFEPIGEIPQDALAGLARIWHHYLSHHHVDWFRIAEMHPEIDVPVYHQTGWYDRLVGGVIDQYAGMVSNGRTEATRRSQRLLIGPWSHTLDFTRNVGAMDFGPEADANCPEIIARWFDHWLKGVDTGIMDEPPIRIFVMGEDRWRYEHEWPLARTRFTSYYVHSGGRARTPAGDGSLSTEQPGDEPADTYVYDPRDPVMSLLLPDGHTGPGDVRRLDHRRDVLVFQTPPLERDVEVTGPVELKLYATSSALDTDWTARLVDVHPDGFAVNLSYGIQRARYRDSWDRPTLIEPGRVYEYTLKLKPTSNLFKVGHRIRLDISSSDFPNYDRNHNTGREYWKDAEFVKAQQEVFHDARYPSHVVLPIVP